MAVRGLWWRVLVMIVWRGTFFSPRWVAAEFPAGVGGEQDAGPVVAQAGTSGVGA
jgi:hypothetical protein